MKESKHLVISGRVQGVGYRNFCRKTARSLSLKGWVRNKSDGTVEIMVTGENDKISEFIERCRTGPRAANVQKIESNDADYTPDFDNFEVRY